MNSIKQMIQEYENERELVKQRIYLLKGNSEQKKWIDILRSTTLSLNIMKNTTGHHNRITKTFDEEKLEFMFLKFSVPNCDTSRPSLYQIRYLRFLLSGVRPNDRKILIEKTRENISARELAIEDGVTESYINYHFYKAKDQCLLMAKRVAYDPSQAYSNEVMNLLLNKT